MYLKIMRSLTIFILSRVFYFLYSQMQTDSLLSTINSLPTGYFYMFFFCRLLIFFQNQLFRNACILSGIPSVSNSFDPDQARHMSGQIWIKLVCKGYQQMTLVEKGFFAWFVVLHPRQQLWPCGDGQFNLTTLFPGQA